MYFTERTTVEIGKGRSWYWDSDICGLALMGIKLDSIYTHKHSTVDYNLAVF